MREHILVFYGTKYGQTAKIAGFIGECLTNNGFAVALVNGDEAPGDLSIAEFDGVIIGGSVIRGRHQRCVQRFVRENRNALNSMPSAFFSVSASAASQDERGRADARRCIETLLHATDWRPALAESLAGALAFTKYNPLVRWMLKQISKRNGGPTDTSRDHEFTDWLQVERFAETFAMSVLQREAAMTGRVP